MKPNGDAGERRNTPKPLIRRPVFIVAVVLAVAASISLLKPSGEVLRWERLAPRAESKVAARTLDRAEALTPGVKTLSPGRYVFAGTADDGRLVTAVLKLPVGAVVGAWRPFHYAATPDARHDKLREVFGTATLRGQVLLLRTAGTNALLHTPLDRTLLDRVTTRGFSALSPDPSPSDSPDDEGMSFVLTP